MSCPRVFKNAEELEERRHIKHPSNASEETPPQRPTHLSYRSPPVLPCLGAADRPLFPPCTASSLSSRIPILVSTTAPTQYPLPGLQPPQTELATRDAGPLGAAASLHEREGGSTELEMQQSVG